MSGQAAIAEFLQKTVGNNCRVVLATGAEIVGTLCTIDGHFNLVVKNANEFVKGEKTNAYESVFVRGSWVVHLTTE